MTPTTTVRIYHDGRKQESLATFETTTPPRVGEVVYIPTDGRFTVVRVEHQCNEHRLLHIAVHVLDLAPESPATKP